MLLLCETTVLQYVFLFHPLGKGFLTFVFAQFLSSFKTDIIYLCSFLFAKKRQVGSGFCPNMSRRERRDGARWAPPFGGGHPRAMLAPDASVGEYGKRNI